MFPQKLSDEEGLELVKRLEFGLKDLTQDDGRTYEYALLDELKDLDRQALRERRILNSGTVAKKSPVGIILSEDEETSIVLNGDDHIRLQILAPGLHLEELWQRADRLDDYINARFPYAFDEKYGYLTSYPTNTGTGLRACAILHLPTLSMGKKFSNMLAELSRFGVTIRGVYGEGSENYGALYEVANQKTLGQSEKEIVELVTKIARQLDAQERKVRRMALENHRLEREDDLSLSVDGGYGRQADSDRGTLLRIPADAGNSDCQPSETFQQAPESGGTGCSTCRLSEKGTASFKRADQLTY